MFKTEQVYAFQRVVRKPVWGISSPVNEWPVVSRTSLAFGECWGKVKPSTNCCSGPFYYFQITLL